MRTISGSPEVELAAAVADLRETCDRLATLAGDGAWLQVPAACLPELVASALTSLDQAAAATSTAVGVVHRSGALASLGYVSTSRWLQERAGLSPSGAAATLARSRDLHEGFGATREAWLAGEVSGAVVREVTGAIAGLFRGVPEPHRSDQVRAAERILLDVAREGGTPSDVRRAAGRVRVYVDPDGANAAAMAAYDDQTLSCTHVGSMARIDGWLDHEGAAVVEAALDAIMDGWFRDGTLGAEDLPVDGEDPLSDVVRRRRRLRRGHLRALALVELARRQVEDGTLGTRHEVKPHVTYTVDAADVAAGLGADLVVPGREEPIRVTSDTIRRVLCDAVVAPVATAATTGPDRLASGSGERVADGVDVRDVTQRLVDASHRVLYVGRDHRIVPPRLRRALEVRDRHCVAAGCRVEPARCHAHHVREWSDGGASDLDNLALLCPRHHRLVHEGGHALEAVGADPRAGGHWQLVPPRPRRP